MIDDIFNNNAVYEEDVVLEALEIIEERFVDDEIEQALQYVFGE